MTYLNLSFLFLSCSCRGRGSQEWCLWVGVFPQNPSQPHSTWPNPQHPALWDWGWSPGDTRALVALPLHLGKGPTQNPMLYENFSPFTSLLGTGPDLSGKTKLGVGENSSFGSYWQLLGVEKMGSWLPSDCGLGSEIFVSG